LDLDRDFLLSRDDLLKYGGHALTELIIERIFSEDARPFMSGVRGRMGYVLL
jgi:serine/threonine-protein phosphatase 2A regulatory subunit B''